MNPRSKKKRACLSVINDLTREQRVHKIAIFLTKKGYDVILVGRRQKKSLPLTVRSYKTKRFWLPFENGLLFYLSYNLRLFFYLIYNRFDILVANDLDTLSANFFASVLSKNGLNKLVYDSHEYFTEIPELVNRPFIKRIWEKAEKTYLPKIKHSYTVCKSIADIYNNLYGLNMKVVRNVPPANSENIDYSLADKIKYRVAARKVVIYQGAVNVGRGIEFAIKSIKLLENTVLIIAGGGDILDVLIKMVKTENIEDKVIFTGEIAFEQLRAITYLADVGISLEQNIGLNYYYALPNKLFDYIHAQIPVLTSDLPEIRNIVGHYNIGITTNDFTAENLSSLINEIIFNTAERAIWNKGLKKAKEELCWENEVKVLETIVRSVVGQL